MGLNVRDTRSPLSLAERELGYQPPIIPDSAAVEGVSTAFIEGLRKIRAEQGPHYPITANTTAHLVDPEGKCSVESRTRAALVLDQLIDNAVVIDSGYQEIGGDHIRTYDLAV